MNQTRVDNGHAMECAVALALGRRPGVKLIRDARLTSTLYALRNCAFRGAKTPSERLRKRKRMRKQGEWLADRLLKKEPYIHTVQMTGQNANFADITCYASDNKVIACSVKHNSKEIGGQRLSRNNAEVLPLPGKIESSAKFRKEVEPIFCFLDDQAGRYFENQPWQRDILDELAAQALARELHRINAAEIFPKIIAPKDHYMLIGGNNGALIDGFNFNGSLRCRQVRIPTDTPTILVYGKRKPINRVSVGFRDGFKFEWRAHVKGKISKHCYGGSLYLTGVPQGFYREEQ